MDAALAKKTGVIGEFKPQMKDVTGDEARAMPRAVPVPPSPELVQANRAALGIDETAAEELRKAFDDFFGSIVCKTGITGAAVGAGCPNPVALVRNAQEEIGAQRIQKLIADKGITLRIERTVDFSEKIQPTTLGQKHLEQINKLVEEGNFIDARAYLDAHTAELYPSALSPLSKHLAEKQKALDDILERASRDLNIELTTEKNSALKESATAVVKRLKPTHITNTQSAQKILQRGRILSSKRLGLSNKYYAERGLENGVFFGYGAPFEHFKTGGPIFVARKDMLRAHDFSATPFDSVVYHDMAEIAGNSFTDTSLLDGYLHVLVQNEGTIPSLRTVRGKKITPFPEIRFESEIALDEMEVIIVSPEDYKLFIADPAIPEKTKTRLMSSKWFDTDDPTEAYYKYTALDCVRDQPLSAVI